VAIIFAGTNGLLDDLAWKIAARLKLSLYRFLENSRPGHSLRIREKKIIDDALKADLTQPSTKSKAAWRRAEADPGRSKGLAGCRTFFVPLAVLPPAGFRSRR